jgi:hypothetical protein
MKTIVVPILLVAGLAACGQKDSSGSDSAAPSEADASPASEPQGAGRDLASVDVCELIPANAVASAVGGQIDGPAEATDPGFDGKGCRYRYRLADGRTGATEISLHPPSEFDFWRTTQSFPLTDLDGIGDGAYWGKRTGETNLFVLARGDVTVRIRAISQELEQAQAIAGAVLEHL